MFGWRCASAESGNVPGTPQANTLDRFVVRRAGDVVCGNTRLPHGSESFRLSEISYMMHAGEPELVVSDRIMWRVPVILSLTAHGAYVAITVDVESGQMAISPETMASPVNASVALSYG